VTQAVSHHGQAVLEPLQINKNKNRNRNRNKNKITKTITKLE
jgi:hypothetical protein